MALTEPGVNSAAQGVVAILDGESFAVLFAAASPMRCTVREPSTLATWGVEDGTERSDHRTIGRVEIDLPLLLTDDTRALYEQLRSVFLAGTPLVVQTKVASYPDMLILDLPHDETPDGGDSILINAKFAELVTVEPQFGALPPASVSDPKQASTVDRGNQQTTESTPATQRRASVLYGIVN
jgi:hypothetical protein